jgi:hypothetical protein
MRPITPEIGFDRSNPAIFLPGLTILERAIAYQGRRVGGFPGVGERFAEPEVLN